MSFRNDRDADLARIDALEHELKGARRQIPGARGAAAGPSGVVERVVERVVEGPRAPEPRAPEPRALEPRAVPAVPVVRAPGPYGAQATTSSAAGRMIASTSSTGRCRSSPAASSCARSATGRTCAAGSRSTRSVRRGSAAAGGSRSRSASGVHRAGLHRRTHAARVDRHRDARGRAGASCAAWSRTRLILIASAIIAVPSLLLAAVFNQVRTQESHELFERVAGMLGAEPSGGALPAGAAVAADDERAR